MSLVNTIAADALAPSVARTSATMLLILHTKQILVFHEEGFQPTSPPQAFTNDRKYKHIFMFLQNDSAHNVLILDAVYHLSECVQAENKVAAYVSQLFMASYFVSVL